MPLKYALIALSIILLVDCHDSNGTVRYDDRTDYSDFLSDLWLEGGDVIRILWRDCNRKISDQKNSGESDALLFQRFAACMKRKSLRALDRSLNSDEIPLAHGVDLVRYEMIDREGRVVQMDANVSSGLWTDEELDDGDWKTLVLDRMARVLRTHVIKVDLNPNTPERVEFRHRRRHHMMTMMMFGIVSMGLVVVPMGFQFLAVLGGKALLLAKMALLLSSIQGLKKVDVWNRHVELQKAKIATSPLNYGFYPNYPGFDHFESRSFNTNPQKTSHNTKNSRPYKNLNEERSRKSDKTTHRAVSKPRKYPERTSVIQKVTTRPKVKHVFATKADKKSLIHHTHQDIRRDTLSHNHPVYTSDISNVRYHQSTNTANANHPTSQYLGDYEGNVPIFSENVNHVADNQPVFTDSEHVGTIDNPTIANIVANIPTEVHAEYSVDLPENGLHFQSSRALVPP